MSLILLHLVLVGNKSNNLSVKFCSYSNIVLGVRIVAKVAVADKLWIKYLDISEKIATEILDRSFTI